MTDRKKKTIKKCHCCGQLTGNADLDLATGEMVYTCQVCALKKIDNRPDWP